jgi:Glycosyltransferase
LVSLKGISNNDPANGLNMSDKVKVSMVGTLPPLTWNSLYSLELSRSLAPYIDLEFLSFKKLYPKFLYPGKDVEGKILTISDNDEKFKIKRYITYYNPFSWIRAGLFAKGDIVHIQWGVPIFGPVFFTILLFAKLRGKKSIATVHNVLPHEQSFIDKALSVPVFSLVDFFIVHSNNNGQELQEIFNIQQEKIVQVPHGVLNSSSYSIISKSEARKKLGIQSNCKTILFFGNIREYKGLDVLLEAFYLLIKKRKDVLLIIAGTPWIEWDEYEEIIKKHRLEENIKLFLDYIPSADMKYFYYSSDLVVLPYKDFNAQSGIGTDALSFGKPLVVTNVGGLSDLVKDKRFVVEPNNPIALADKMLLVLNDETLVKQLSNDSRNLAEEYSWSKVAKITIESYKNL